MIANLKALCEETCAAHENEESVGRRLFKDTECGIGFGCLEGGVVVAGHADGADAECPGHELKYPFTAESFWAAVKVADEEGCEMWEEWNATSDEEGVL